MTSNSSNRLILCGYGLGYDFTKNHNFHNSNHNLYVYQFTFSKSEFETGIITSLFFIFYNFVECIYIC